mgnify:CR=1 FL=1
MIDEKRQSVVFYRSTSASSSSSSRALFRFLVAPPPPRASSPPASSGTLHRGQRVAGTSRAPSVHSPRHIAHFHSVVELDASAGNGVVGDASGGALVVVACASPDSLAPDQYRRGVAAAFASRHVVNGMRRVFGVVRAAAVGSARRRRRRRRRARPSPENRPKLRRFPTFSPTARFQHLIASPLNGPMNCFVGIARLPVGTTEADVVDVVDVTASAPAPDDARGDGVARRGRRASRRRAEAPSAAALPARAPHRAPRVVRGVRVDVIAGRHRLGAEQMAASCPTRGSPAKRRAVAAAV